MKIKYLMLKNFRSYKGETKINFDDLTVLVGKNDIGKSTILEALDIFFNCGKFIKKLWITSLYYKNITKKWKIKVYIVPNFFLHFFKKTLDKRKLFTV